MMWELSVRQLVNKISELSEPAMWPVFLLLSEGSNRLWIDTARRFLLTEHFSRLMNDSFFHGWAYSSAAYKR